MVLLYLHKLVVLFHGVLGWFLHDQVLHAYLQSRSSLLTLAEILFAGFFYWQMKRFRRWCVAVAPKTWAYYNELSSFGMMFWMSLGFGILTFVILKNPVITAMISSLVVFVCFLSNWSYSLGIMSDWPEKKDYAKWIGWELTGNKPNFVKGVNPPPSLARFFKCYAYQSGFDFSHINTVGAKEEVIPFTAKLVVTAQPNADLDKFPGLIEALEKSILTILQDQYAEWEGNANEFFEAKLVNTILEKIATKVVQVELKDTKLFNVVKIGDIASSGLTA